MAGPYPLAVGTDAELTPAVLVRDLDLDTLPAELRGVLGRLMRRLRGEHRFPLTQASVLGWLDRDGPRSIGELAAIESVRPQSMSQTISSSKPRGSSLAAPTQAMVAALRSR